MKDYTWARKRKSFVTIGKTWLKGSKLTRKKSSQVVEKAHACLLDPQHVFSWVLPLVLGLDAWVFSLHLQSCIFKDLVSWLWLGYRSLPREILSFETSSWLLRIWTSLHQLFIHPASRSHAGSIGNCLASILFLGVNLLSRDGYSQAGDRMLHVDHVSWKIGPCVGQDGG